MAAHTLLQYSSWSVKALEQRYRNNEVIMLVLYACISLNMAHKLSIQTHRRSVCVGHNIYHVELGAFTECERILELCNRVFACQKLIKAKLPLENFVFDTEIYENYTQR